MAVGFTGVGLNNLAPDIVEAIVAGTEPDGLSIAQIMKNIPEPYQIPGCLQVSYCRYWILRNAYSR